MDVLGKILLEMNTIEEDKPLALEYDSDARYTWPERWNRLRYYLETKRINECQHEKIYSDTAGTHCPECGLFVPVR
jgi:hypothetical protein